MEWPDKKFRKLKKYWRLNSTTVVLILKTVTRLPRQVWCGACGCKKNIKHTLKISIVQKIKWEKVQKEFQSIFQQFIYQTMIIKFIYIDILYKNMKLITVFLRKLLIFLLSIINIIYYIFPSLFVLKYLFKKVSNNCRFTLKVTDIMHNSIQKAGNSLNPLIF